MQDASPFVGIHIPHSSKRIPYEYRDQFVLSDEELSLELLKMTDTYTDDLFDLDDLGTFRFIHPVSRLLLDPERFLDDELEPMAAVGMGAVYTKTSDGRPLRENFDRDDLIERFYKPHHFALDTWADRTIDTYYYALLIDAHSFPSTPLPCDQDQEPDRPDICIGTDSFHTPTKLRKLAVSLFQRAEFSVSIDAPYSGTMVPGSMFQSEECFHSIMIEVNRRLYMDEATGAKSSGYEKARRVIGECTSALAEGWIDIG